MKLRYILALTIIVATVGGPVQAQQTAPAPVVSAKQVCATEHQSVIANCKNGDPCGPACKAAHKQMKACRIANNIPPHEHEHAHQSPCKTAGALPPGGAPPVSPAPAQ